VCRVDRGGRAGRCGYQELSARSDHTFVGLIAFYDSDWVFQHRCTGELLTPTVVLTAGHCTDDGNGGVNAHARIWVLQDVGSHFDGTIDAQTGYPTSCTGTLGDGIAGGWCAESDTMYNYGFDNFAGFPDIHDTGIVILDTAIDVNEFGELAGDGTVDTLIKARGTQDVTMRVSGYGLSYRLLTPPRQGGGTPASYTISYRVRLQADMNFINLTSATRTATRSLPRATARTRVARATATLAARSSGLPTPTRSSP
jgi:hypothetical protein